MSYISIPGVEKPVSKLIMGSMMLSDEKMEYSAELLDAYISAGGNAIDTAHVYGPHGMKAIGNWMRERGNRSSMTLIGKGAHPDAAGPRMTKSAIDADLSESLERMQTEYVDIFMLHRDDPNKSVGEILELLQGPLEAGLCWALGASNWTTKRLEEANAYAARHGLTGFACNSPNLSLAKPNEPRWAGCVSAGAEDIAWHIRTQLPLLSWSSQAGGFFTGRYSPEKREDPEAVRVYYSEANWERYRRASRLAEEKGTDANQIALAYVLHQPFPTCALIGSQTPAEVFSSAEALRVSLTHEEIRWLDLQN
ncbi:aldo/keto reductase [Cohnella pontilimi]|uniref:Aldo/keto reductase n=1 Tax=Cohnella pontilimi TaxID=2564100 RepID=A0A4V5LRZ2_9BACL|nr:aldo/keto reductase [Cohnella pontilimi]TJY41179.1 aldo/keto reductase [Cohnella pontilimi]